MHALDLFVEPVMLRAPARSIGEIDDGSFNPNVALFLVRTQFPTQLSGVNSVYALKLLALRLDRSEPRLGVRATEDKKDANSIVPGGHEGADPHVGPP